MSTGRKRKLSIAIWLILVAICHFNARGAHGGNSGRQNIVGRDSGKDNSTAGSVPLDTLKIEEITIHENQTRRTSAAGSLLIEQINSTFLRQRRTGSLLHTLQTLPGVQALTIGPGHAKPMIRGLGFNQVVVLDNGLRHQGQEWGVDHGLEVDQFRIGRAEIIKGPAAVRYGSDALGGAILLHSPPPPPPHTLGGALDLTGKTNNKHYGSSLRLFGRGKYWFADTRLTLASYADFQIPADSLYIYDYAVALNRGRVRNTAGRETGLHARVGYAAPRIQTALSTSVHWLKSGFFANAHGLEPRNVDRQLHDRSDRDLQMPHQSVLHWKMSTETAFEIGRHRWTAVAGVQRNLRQEENVYVSHGYMPPVFPDHLPFPSTLERHYDKTSIAARLEDRIDYGSYQLGWGVSGEYQNNNVNGWNFLTPAFRQATAGMFADGEIKITDQTTIYGAIRFDHSRIHTDPYRDWFPSDFQTEIDTINEEAYLLRALSLDRRFNSFTWSAGIGYTRHRFALVANIGTGFRLPIAKELAANGVNYHYFRYEKGDPSLSPEKSWQLDIGGRWSGLYWSAQVDPYLGYFVNYLYLNPTSEFDYTYGAGNQVFYYTEAEVLRWGAEARIQLNFSPRWSTELNGEFLRSRQLSGEKKGYTLPFSPPPACTWTIRWEDMNRKVFGVEQPYISFDYRITTKQRSIVPPEKMTPGSQIADLSVGGTIVIERQQVAVGLRLLNVFNTKYTNHLSFYRLIDMPEAGRNLIVTVQIPFTKTFEK